MDNTATTVRVGEAYKLVDGWRPNKAGHTFGATHVKLARITVPYALQPTKVATVDQMNNRMLSLFPGPYGVVWTRVDTQAVPGIELEHLDAATWGAVVLGPLPMPYIALAAYLNAPGCNLPAQGSGEERWVKRHYYPVYGFVDGVCKLLPLDTLGLDQPNVYVAAYQMAYKPDYRVMLDRKLP